MNSNKKCLRCNNKEATFSCLMCESFKFLCTQCDNYVHGLPSKKKHNRTAIIITNMNKFEENKIAFSQAINKEEKHNNYLQQNEEENIGNLKYGDYKLPNRQNSNSPSKNVDWDHKFNFNSNSNPNIYIHNNSNSNNSSSRQNNNEPQQFLNKNNNLHIIDNYSNQNENFNSIKRQYYDKTDNNENNENNLYFSQPISSNQTAVKTNFSTINNEDYKTTNIASSLNSNDIVNYSHNNLNTFSRDYMNEVKTVYEREKSELNYKNSSLQNNLDRLKSTFGEQIINLNSDLEDLQKKNSLHLKALQDNYEVKYKCMLDEKDSYIEQLLNRIDELDNFNKELSSKVEQNLKYIYEIKDSYNHKVHDLELDLKIKDEEILKIRENNERKVVNYENIVEDDKKKLTFEYEAKIEKMLEGFEEAREKMTNMLQEREKDIKKILQHNEEDSEFYQSKIEELKHEIECHKQNIVNIRGKRDNFEDEISTLNEYINNLKKETKFQLAEIKLLDNQNKILIKENEDLKIQVSKLDKLVYGKIRAPTFKNNQI